MFPKISRRSSLISHNQSITPIFSSRFSSFDGNSNYGEKTENTEKDIKSLQSRIAKLKHDNKMLKEFILSTKIIHLNSKGSGDPSKRILQEFQKLETFLK